MKILIVGYYDLKESLLAASIALEKRGHTVICYPMFQKVYDTRSKIPNYKEDFLKFIVHESPQVILWWFSRVPTDVFQYIENHVRKLNIYTAMFNWDDPWCWYEPGSTIREKAKFLDLAMPTCKGTLKDYIKHGAKNAVFCPPGVDTNHYFPLKNIKYKCDVSMVITNLYQDDYCVYQYVPRKDIVDALYADQSITFHIYGPEFLKTIYPKSYQGYANYDNINEVFNTSRINLSTHICYHQEGYMNERCVDILASGGLLLVDPVKGLDKLITPDECVFMQTNKKSVKELLVQIKGILSNYSNMERIKAKGRAKAESEFTWDSWASVLLQNIPIEIISLGTKPKSLVFHDTNNKLTYEEQLAINSAFLEVQRNHHIGLEKLTDMVDKMKLDDDTIHTLLINHVNNLNAYV